ncbi:MAG: hypothetical protein M1836_003211 [Candelina mexicana]|nr:MAG: hypothetical protein M1836_003211 [Candelina mexicana]
MDGPRKSNRSETHGSIDWQHLPVEIILEIIFRLPFSPKGSGDLLIVNKRLNGILKTYQRSLSNSIAISQFPQVASIFPPYAIADDQPPKKPRLSFAYLTTLFCRQETLNNIAAKTATLNMDTTYHLRESLPHWQRLQTCGLLLLYLLHDRATHAAKTSFLASLPLPSLALLNLATLLGTRAASEMGAGIIHSSYAADDAEMRSDIHLVFAELMLRHGPGFLARILSQQVRETREVSRELEWLDEYQIHEVGVKRERTLGSLLREAFARRCGCQGQEVGSRLWKELQRPELWNMGDRLMVEVVGMSEEALVGLGA